MRSPTIGPESDLIPGIMGAALEQGIILKPQIARLQITLAGRGLGRDQLGIGDGHDHLVEIGQLYPMAVDAVEIGIADKDFPRADTRLVEHPWLQDRQVGIGILIGLVHVIHQRGPAAFTAFFHLRLQRTGIGIIAVELLQVMGRHVDIERGRRRQFTEKGRVRIIPAVAHGIVINHLEHRQLVIDAHDRWRAARTDQLIERDIFPVEAEILSRERLPVRPAMTGAQMQGKDPLVLDLDALQNIGSDIEVLVIGNQPGIAVDDHLAHILVTGHQHRQPTAGATEITASLGRIGDTRCQRQAFRYRRQFTLGHRLIKAWWIHIGRQVTGQRHMPCQQHEGTADNGRNACPGNQVLLCHACALTR